MFDDILGPVIDKIDGRRNRGPKVGSDNTDNPNNPKARDKSWGAATGTIWSSDAQVSNPDWDVDPGDGWDTDDACPVDKVFDDCDVKGCNEDSSDGFSDGLYDV